MTEQNLSYLMPPYKNLSTGLLFSVFFGPLGLLYASVRGGIVMLLMAFVVFSFRYPVPIMMMWVISSVWSVTAINHYNAKLLEARIRNNNEEKDRSAVSSR